MPREIKCTPELTAQIAKIVAMGATIPHACAACNVSWNTAKAWMTPEMSSREPYASFVEAMDLAKGRWAAGAAVEITKAGKEGEWKALAWMLERRNPTEFGATSKVELAGRDGGPIETAQVRYVIALPPEEPEED